MLISATCHFMARVFYALSTLLATTVVSGSLVLSPQLAAAGQPDPVALLARVKTLTAPELAGRGSGAPETAAAADTIAHWLSAAGLQPAFSGAWLQEFPLTGENHAGRSASNVAGLLPGDGPLAERWVIVGAHYDHLGRVDPASGPELPQPGEYYPGANDNASGVTLLVELARLAAAGGDCSDDQDAADGAANPGRRSVLFVAFAAEEIGLQGSAHLVNHPPLELESVDLMINFDSVGRLRDDRLHVSGVGTAENLGSLVRRLDDGGLPLRFAESGWAGSDHIAFLTREVGALFLFTGAYPEYNRPTDDWPTLDIAGLAQIAAFANRLLESVRRVPGAFAYLSVDRPQLEPAGDADLNRNTWFGSMPDFTDEVAGYKLASVFEKSPAARAGLVAGDVVIRLGGYAVTDLASFTRALRSHSPGEIVEVEVARRERTLRYTVVLGDRRQR